MNDENLIPLLSIKRLRGEVVGVEVSSKKSSLHSLVQKQPTDFILSSKSVVVMIGDTESDIKVGDTVMLREANMNVLSVYATHSEKRTEPIKGTNPQEFEEVEYNLGIAIIPVYDVVMVLN